MFCHNKEAMRLAVHLVLITAGSVSALAGNLFLILCKISAAHIAKIFFEKMLVEYYFSLALAASGLIWSDVDMINVVSMS